MAYNPEQTVQSEKLSFHGNTEELRKISEREWRAEVKEVQERVKTFAPRSFQVVDAEAAEYDMGMFRTGMHSSLIYRRCVLICLMCCDFLQIEARKTGVVFVDDDNACTSLMAHAFTRSMHSGSIRSLAGGISATPMNKLTGLTLQGAGLELSANQKPTAFATVLLQKFPFEWAICLSAAAADVCTAALETHVVPPGGKKIKVLTFEFDGTTQLEGKVRIDRTMAVFEVLDSFACVWDQPSTQT